MTGSTHFPFSAIVGHADMKDALLCNAVYPGIGGVLISGTRGTAKSTAARSLARLLPQIRAVSDCPFHCPPDDPESQCARCSGRDVGNRPDMVEEIRTPFVNLPIGATEDRVLGTIDFESAIQEGERSFEPGLLARANRGILYVDEVNLLADHLVDVLLDAVATGTNRVEREGISFEHPADVMLVGTMNPEEGELRPQLLDRFGLYVDMDGGMEPEERKAVVRRRTTYDDDPERMVGEWREEEAALSDRIEDAKAILPDVSVDDETLERIVTICAEHDVDGLRADIVMHRTARGLAALDGERAVGEAHVIRAAELALGHRSRSTPSPDPRGPDSPGGDETGRETSTNPPERPPPEELPDFDRSGAGPDEEASGGGDGGREDDDGVQAQDGVVDDRVFPITPGIAPPRTEPRTRTELPGIADRGGRTRAGTADRRGSYCRARRPRGRIRDVALDATVRAAAPHQVARGSGDTGALTVSLRPSDLREKVRRAPVQHLVVFVVDSSGSMGAYDRMSAVKGAILSLLEGAYQQRDYVSLIGFRGDRAETLLPPTSSVSHAARALADMPTGGRTPLAAGLDRGLQLVKRERRRKTNLVPLLVLVTDGRSNHSEASTSPVQEALTQAKRIGENNVPAFCFDTETGPVRMGIVGRLAEQMGAVYYRLDELEPGGLSEAVTDVFYGRSRPWS